MYGFPYMGDFSAENTSVCPREAVDGQAAPSGEQLELPLGGEQ